MKNRALFISLLLMIILISGCGIRKTSTEESNPDPSPTSNTTPTCETGDETCFLNGMILVEQDGSYTTLVTITQTLPLTNGDLGLAPSITEAPNTMFITDPDYVYAMFLSWTDPNGLQPAFCMFTCPKNVRCITSRYRCSRSVPDGLISGVWRTWLGYQVSPAGPVGTTDELDLNIIPISTPSGDDPIGIFEDIIDEGGDIADLSEDEISMGEAITIPQTVQTPETDAGGNDEDDGGGTGSSGSSCTSSSQCSKDCFSARSCIPSVFNNTCSCAGTSTPGTCENALCNNVGGSCGSGSGCCVGLTCVNGTCEYSDSRGRCPL